MVPEDLHEQRVQSTSQDLECLSRSLSQIPSLLQSAQENASLPPVSTLLVGPDERKLYVHTTVLLTRCRYVSTMFNSSMLESQTGLTNFRLPDLTVEGVQACIEFMYSASFTVSKATVVQILEAAKYLLMESIENHCAEYIGQHIDCDTAMELLDTALLLNCMPLQEVVLKYIAKNAKAVFKVTCLTSSLRDISCDQLLAILSRPDLGATEEEVYRFSLSWLDAHVTDAAAGDITDQVLGHICYAAMGVNYLRWCLSQSDHFRSSQHREWLEEGLAAKHEGAHRVDAIHASRTGRVPKPAVVMHGTAGFRSLHPVDLTLNAGARMDGNVLDLSSGDAYAVLKDPKGGVLDATTQCFFEAWVCPCYLAHAAAFSGPVLSKHGLGTGWELRLSGDCVEFMITLRKGQVTWHELVACNREVLPGRWLHIAGSFDGVSAVLYVNKERVAVRQPEWNNWMLHQKPQGAQPVPCCGDVHLGRNPQWEDRKLICKLAGVRIFTDQIPGPTDFLPLEL